jgi:hypothetical protein
VVLLCGRNQCCPPAVVRLNRSVGHDKIQDDLGSTLVPGNQDERVTSKASIRVRALCKHLSNCRPISADDGTGDRFGIGTARQGEKHEQDEL